MRAKDAEINRGEYFSVCLMLHRRKKWESFCNGVYKYKSRLRMCVLRFNEVITFLLYSLQFFIFNQIISFFILLIIISFTSYNSTKVATRNTALNQKRISLSILHLDCNKTRRKVTRIYNDRRPSSIYSSIASHLGTLHFDIHTHLFAESVSHVTL